MDPMITDFPDEERGSSCHRPELPHCLQSCSRWAVNMRCPPGKMFFYRQRRVGEFQLKLGTKKYWYHDRMLENFDYLSLGKIRKWRKEKVDCDVYESQWIKTDKRKKNQLFDFSTWKRYRWISIKPVKCLILFRNTCYSKKCMKLVDVQSDIHDGVNVV